MATYVGPQTSPVFVTGVINDAWEEAVSRTAQARAALADLNPVPVSAQALTPLQAPDDLSVDLPSIADPEEGAGPALEDQLASLFRSFIAANYPAIAVPDAAAAWARVAATFTGAPLAQAVARARQRIDTPWTARGYTMPTEARQFLRREHDREAARIAAGSVRNQDIILKTHRKSVDLTGYEVVMRTQLEALDAARAFLVGVILATLNKQSDEQVKLTAYKAQLQDTFFRYLNARIEENSTELDRLVLEKRIALDADLSAEDRQAFIFRQLVQAAVDEMQSLASQASAAINRISASASVGGRESTP